MTEYYIKMKDLADGYQGNALISDINLKIKKGRDRDTDRSQWSGKIYNIKKHHQTVKADWQGRYT